MKKIRLNVASMHATEILSRDQLKSIFGGGSHNHDCDDRMEGLSPTCTHQNEGVPCSYVRYSACKIYNCSGTCGSDSVTIYSASCIATCKLIV